LYKGVFIMSGISFVTHQRKMAMKLLKAGKEKVWFNPEISKQSLKQKPELISSG